MCQAIIQFQGARAHHNALFILSVIHRSTSWLAFCHLARCFTISNQLGVSQQRTFQLVCNLIVFSTATWEYSSFLNTHCTILSLLIQEMYKQLQPILVPQCITIFHANCNVLIQCIYVVLSVWN